MQAASDQLVSVIVPSYDQSRYIADALRSALAQTHEQLEVIVCDDASSDDSLDVVRGIRAEFPNRRVVVLESDTNRGVSSARNRGMRAAKGRFLAFLDADDVWEPDKIEKQLAVFGRRPEVGLVFTGARPFASEATIEWLRGTPGLSVHDLRHWVDNDNAFFRRFRPRNRWDYLEAFLDASYLCWSSVVVRSDVACAIGGFNEHLKFQSEDWLFVLSALLITEIHGVAEKLTRYRIHPASYTCSVLIQDSHDSGREQRLRSELLQALRDFSLDRGYSRASGADRFGLLRFLTMRGARRVRRRAEREVRRLVPDRLARAIRARLDPPPELELLVLFVTSACNLSCGFCFYADNLNTRNDLHLDRLLAMIDSAPRVGVIELGGGEPFANRNLDEVIVRCLAKADLVSLNTNGTLAEHTDRVLRSVIAEMDGASGRLQISVSIDGLSATHNKVRRADCFDTILATLRQLHELRAETGAFSLHVNTTMTADNYREVPALMDFLIDELELDYHNVEIERSNPSAPFGLRVAPEGLYEVYEQVLERIRRVYPGMYEESRARFSIQYLNKTEGRAWPFPCTAGKSSLVVYEDGRFATCEVLDVAGHVADFDYDLRKVLASAVVRDHVAEIAKGECFCTHGCWLISSRIGHDRGREPAFGAINPKVFANRTAISAREVGG